jgi:hypothetical protein
MINIFMAQTAAALLQLARLGHGRVAFSMASVVIHFEWSKIMVGLTVFEMN